MSSYLVIVWLLLPGQPSQEVRIELHREYIRASSASVCQEHAKKLEVQQRAKHADTAERLRAKVAGACVFLPPIKE